MLIGIGGIVILFALKLIPQYVMSTMFTWGFCIVALLVDQLCMAIRERDDSDGN